jgi:Zn-dependent protease
MFRGAFRLFRFAGVQVFLHWSWFILAYFEVRSFAHRYWNPIWAVGEFLALFAIVLAHEFGHALACRSTGGKAERIVLWPLGGLAFVEPPPRATALLWSIAAGPLVNAVLFPVLSLLVWVMIQTHHVPHQAALIGTDAYTFSLGLFGMNAALLFFNLLPIYPLDGGQILRALLWFRLGQIRSLEITSVVGMIGALGLGAMAIWLRSIWIGIIAFFIFTQAGAAIQRAKVLALEADTALPVTGVPPEPQV